jgi:hypothetical protein
MAYIYKHIRLDKNEPFYIGIGFDGDGKYKRAYKRGRNDIWEKIVNKTNYIVEIIEDGLSNKEVIEREKYWIKLFGRIDNNTGILSNLTDGGEGTLGCIPSDEVRKKISDKQKQKKNLEHLKRVSENNRGKPSWNKGKIGVYTHTEGIKIKISEGVKSSYKINPELKSKRSETGKNSGFGNKNKPKIKCPYCNKEMNVGNLKQWHGENCKSKNIMYNSFW